MNVFKQKAKEVFSKILYCILAITLVLGLMPNLKTATTRAYADEGTTTEAVSTASNSDEVSAEGESASQDTGQEASGQDESASQESQDAQDDSTQTDEASQSADLNSNDEAMLTSEDADEVSGDESDDESDFVELTTGIAYTGDGKFYPITNGTVGTSPFSDSDVADKWHVTVDTSADVHDIHFENSKISSSSATDATFTFLVDVSISFSGQNEIKSSHSYAFKINETQYNIVIQGDKETPVAKLLLVTEGQTAY